MRTNKAVRFLFVLVAVVGLSLVNADLALAGSGKNKKKRRGVYRNVQTSRSNVDGIPDGYACTESTKGQVRVAEVKVKGNGNAILKKVKKNKLKKLGTSKEELNAICLAALSDESAVAKDLSDLPSASGSMSTDANTAALRAFLSMSGGDLGALATPPTIGQMSEAARSGTNAFLELFNIKDIRDRIEGGTASDQDFQDMHHILGLVHVKTTVARILTDILSNGTSQCYLRRAPESSATSFIGKSKVAKSKVFTQHPTKLRVVQISFAGTDSQDEFEGEEEGGDPRGGGDGHGGQEEGGPGADSNIYVRIHPTSALAAREDGTEFQLDLGEFSSNGTARFSERIRAVNDGDNLKLISIGSESGNGHSFVKRLVLGLERDAEDPSKLEIDHAQPKEMHIRFSHTDSGEREGPGSQNQQRGGTFTFEAKITISGNQIFMLAKDTFESNGGESFGSQRAMAAKFEPSDAVASVYVSAAVLSDEFTDPSGQTHERRLATAFNTDSGLYEAKEPSDSSVSALATFVGGVDFDADSFFNDVLSIEEPFDKKPSKRQVTERVQINFDDPAWEEVESACEGDRSMDRISDEIEDVIRRIDEDLHENGAPEPPRKDLPGDGSDPNQQQ